MDQQAASSSADTPSYVSLVRLLQAHPFDFAQFKAQLLYLQSATAPFDINYRIHSDRPREYRRSLLSHATLEKQHSAVKLLLKRGANPNVAKPDNSGNYSLETPLHIAAILGNEDAVRLLLKWGANPNCCRSPKLRVYAAATPLHYATYNQHSIIVSLLLHCKANPNARLSHTSARYPGATPLYFAVLKNDIQLVRMLLAHGAVWHAVVAFPRTTQFIEWYQTGITPLHRAACYGYLNIMQELLEAGASPNAAYICANGGRTPLHFAVLNNQWKAAELLLKFGADPDALVLAAHRVKTGGAGYGALHQAARQSIMDETMFDQMTELLLDWGANPNLQAKKSFLPEVPLDLTLYSTVRIACLFRFGADPFLTTYTYPPFTAHQLFETYRTLLSTPLFIKRDRSLLISTEWLLTFFLITNVKAFPAFPSLKLLAICSLLASGEYDHQPPTQIGKKTLPMSQMGELGFLFFRAKPIVDLSKKYGISTNTTPPCVSDLNFENYPTQPPPGCIVS